MNYYIDFDSTLYETAKLTELMLKAIGKKIGELAKLDAEPLIKDAIDNFKSSTDNIFTHAENMGEKYNVDKCAVVSAVKAVLNNGKEIVYEDTVRFLKKLKEKGHRIYMLTFIYPGNQEYQMQKILGSELAQYFDVLIITTERKYSLDIDYENGIFIDDNPKDLTGLYERKPLRLIRMRRPNNKRSNIEMDIKEIEEVASFDEINID